MNRKQAVLLISSLILSLLFFQQPEQPSEEIATVVMPFPPAVEEKKSESKVDSLSEWVQKESEKLRMISSDSDGDLEILLEKAQGLQPTDFETLSVKTLDINSPQDERFLSVYLLGLAVTNEAAFDALTRISESAWPAELNERNQEFELLVRAHAVEVMAQLPDSPELRRKLKLLRRNLEDNNSAPFLIDRVERSLANLGKAQSVPVAQDDQALRKILERD